MRSTSLRQHVVSGGRSKTEVNPKRYRYTGKERDEETGFAYHGARYYAPWLGRWTAADPLGLADGVNTYWSFHDNPIHFVDPDGREGEEPYNFYGGPPRTSRLD